MSSWWLHQRVQREGASRFRTRSKLLNLDETACDFSLALIKNRLEIGRKVRQISSVTLFRCYLVVAQGSERFFSLPKIELIDCR